MGKGKKRGQSKTYTREKFVDKVCFDCSVCGDLTDAAFCYDAMYKQDRRLFLNRCRPLITALSEWPMAEMGSDDAMAEMDLFEEVFCNSGICKTGTTGINCNNIYNCMEAMREQVMTSISSEEEEDEDEDEQYENQFNHLWGGTIDQHYPMAKGKNRNKKKNKNKKKVGPVAIFFSNNPKKWEERIQRILYGNNNSEQDKAKASTA